MISFAAAYPNVFVLLENEQLTKDVLSIATGLFITLVLGAITISGMRRNSSLRKRFPDAKSQFAEGWRWLAFIAICVGVCWIFRNATTDDLIVGLMAVAAASMIVTEMAKPAVDDKLLVRDRPSPVKKTEVEFGDTVDPIVTYVAGVTFDDHQAVINSLGCDNLITLKPEKDNPHDEYAVQVLVGKDQKMIGYIPKIVTEKVGRNFHLFTIPEMPRRGKIVKFTNQNTDHVGVEIRFEIPDRESLMADSMFWFDYTHPMM